MIIGGERTKLQAAHHELCYSRAFIVHANLLQTREMLFDAHGKAFWFSAAYHGVASTIFAHCR